MGDSVVEHQACQNIINKTIQLWINTAIQLWITIAKCESLLTRSHNQVTRTQGPTSQQARYLLIHWRGTTPPTLAIPTCLPQVLGLPFSYFSSMKSSSTHQEIPSKYEEKDFLMFIKCLCWILRNLKIFVRGKHSYFSSQNKYYCPNKVKAQTCFYEHFMNIL